jgi:predicted nucleic acid-binding protein
VNAILDTTVLVDLLRNYNRSVQWLEARQSQTFGITPIVFLEVVSGTQNKIAQQRAFKRLSQFAMVYLTREDFDWTMQQLVRYRLSHNVGMMDCLIASVSYRLQMPLYTTNLKHFTPLLGVMAQKPY